MENVPVKKGGSDMVNIDFQVYNTTDEIFNELIHLNKTS